MSSSLSPRTASLVFVLFLFAVSNIHAAETTGTLGGTVKDSTGAVVSGATVTLKEATTNTSRTQQTNPDGAYLFTLVPVGRYQVAVESSGFRKYVQSGITLEVNQNARLDVTLRPGAAEQVVEVTGNVAQVDTVSATLGSVETARRIQDLPLVERDTFQLGLLQAGVYAPDPDDGSGNPFNVSGQRSESLTFLVDGADNTNFLSNNAVVDPNPDAVAEFKILTNNYNAEFGRTSGGVVNQVIKSGTNAFHGNVFEFFRNEDLNARNYFQLERSIFKRNIFGGTFGGPLRKDKTFFFLSYQGARRIEGLSVPKLTVLSPAERGCGGNVSSGCVGTVGDFSELLTGSIDPTTGFDPGQLFDPTTGNPYANNQVPMNPVIGNYISKFLPLPNLPNNQFVASPAGRIQDDQGIVRIDHHISDHDTISGSYIVDDNRDALPLQINKGASTGGNVPVGSALTDAVRHQLGQVTWTHIFTPRVINEVIVGANRDASLQASPIDHTTPADLGFANVSPDDPAGVAPPVMFVGSAFNLGPSPQGPTTLHDVTFHWQDNVSWTRGKHDLKFGVDIRRVRNNFNFDFFTNGSFDFGNFAAPATGDILADFVGGFPDNYFQFANAVYGIRTTGLHFYAQDAWKVHPRLTLDLGLRYEYNTPQNDPHNEIIGFFPGQQSKVFPDAPPSLLYPGDPGAPNNALTFADKNNFAPRLGFAWDMLGNAKLVMRGGYGIFYDIEDGALNLQFGGQAPFGDVVNFNYGGFLAGTDAISDPFTAFAPGTVNPFPFIAKGNFGKFFVPKVSFAFVVDPHFRTPYSQNYNFGFQYQLQKDTVVEAYYVGSLGRKLITDAEVNFPDPTLLAQGVSSDCARPLAFCDANGNLTEAGLMLTNHSNGTSASHQLQVTVDKRFSHGFNLRAAYSLAKTVDVQSGFRSRSSAQTNPLDQSFDRGLADFDATHRLVVSGLWELPINRLFGSDNGVVKALTEGWQVNTIASFQSGTPFTIFQDNGSSGQGSFLERADLVGPTHTFDPRATRTFTAGDVQGSCLPVNPGETVNGNFYFDPTAYDCLNAPFLTFGTSGRNSVRGPGINNWDISILKRFKIAESRSLEFRTEFFNAFNHAQFLNPDAFGFSSTFGQVTQARDPRIIQFALKFAF